MAGRGRRSGVGASGVGGSRCAVVRYVTLGPCCVRRVGVGPRLCRIRTVPLSTWPRQTRSQCQRRNMAAMVSRCKRALCEGNEKQDWEIKKALGWRCGHAKHFWPMQPLLRDERDETRAPQRPAAGPNLGAVFRDLCRISSVLIVDKRVQARARRGRPARLFTSKISV